jgi:hypothetical protein
MKLLSDEVLERSEVVANCRMNREREVAGSNGYARELGFHPLEMLMEREAAGRDVGWLDLCCGSARALVQAAEALRNNETMKRIEIVGVDLVGMFHRPESNLTCLRLFEASVSSFEPDRAFGLITCIHGLHYIGDKLGLIARACSWLADDGLFVASLDLRNIKLCDRPAAGRKVSGDLRKVGMEYDCKRRLLKFRGRGVFELPYKYLGANDQAGPNYTGQAAVDSYYLPDAER